MNAGETNDFGDPSCHDGAVGCDAQGIEAAPNTWIGSVPKGIQMHCKALVMTVMEIGCWTGLASDDCQMHCHALLVVTVVQDNHHIKVEVEEEQMTLMVVVVQIKLVDLAEAD